MNLFMWVAVRTGEFTLGDDQAKVQIMTARLAVTQTLINMLVKNHLTAGKSFLPVFYVQWETTAV